MPETPRNTNWDQWTEGKGRTSVIVANEVDIEIKTLHAELDITRARAEAAELDMVTLAETLQLREALISALGEQISTLSERLAAIDGTAAYLSTTKRDEEDGLDVRI